MSVDRLQEEEYLIRMMSQGSEYAFTQLYDHYRPRIYSVAYRMLKSRELAEEIIQDVFLKIWIKRTELPEIKNLPNYIFFMSRNLVFDRLKKQTYESDHLRQVDIGAGVADADTRIRQQEYQHLLDDAISRLTPQQAQIYRLAKIECLSHEAIAQQLQITRSTVKRHVSDALRSIRSYLKEHPELCVAACLLMIILHKG